MTVAAFPTDPKRAKLRAREEAFCRLGYQAGVQDRDEARRQGYDAEYQRGWDEGYTEDIGLTLGRSAGRSLKGLAVELELQPANQTGKRTWAIRS